MSKKVLWIVLGLVGALVVTGGAATYLLITRPADAPPPEESSSSEPVEESSSEPESQPEEEIDPDDSSSEEVSSEPRPELPSSSVVTTPAPSSTYVPPSAGTSTPSANTQTGNANLVISKTGTNDTTETCRNLYIETTPVTVKNKTVQGDLIVQPTAGSGDITLENIKVTGNIFVSGGGKVNLKNVTAQGMVADKTSGSQTFALSGQTSIPNFWIKSNATLDESGLSSGYSGVDNIYSQEGSAASNNIALKSARVNNLSTSTPTDVTVPADSSVEKVTAGAETHLNGNGTVRELVVSSSDVTYETKPIRVTENGNYQASQGGGSSGGGSGGSSSSSANKLPKPSDLKIYVVDDTIYCSFTGDKGAKSGYVITPYIGSKAQDTVELTSAGSGSPPRIKDIPIINNATSIKNQQIHFAVYAKEDKDKNKYGRSDTVTSAKQTVYLTAGFNAEDLNITRTTASNPVYTISWDEVDFDRTSSPRAPSNTAYTVDYTIRRADGSTAYQAVDRAATSRSSYRIPNVPNDLGNGASIAVTVKAKVNVDPEKSNSYPCTVQPELAISGTFNLGGLPAPAGLTAELPPSGYGLKTSWTEVEGAESYTVTALVGYGTSVQEISQTVTGTSCNFTELVAAAQADSVKTLGFKVRANAPKNSIYDSSAEATLGSTINVPIKLSAPTAASMAITLLTETDGTDFQATWGTVVNANQYRVFATHYYKSGKTEQHGEATPNASEGTTQSRRFTDNVVRENPSSPSDDYVLHLTFTAQTLARPNSWFRDSDPQESGSFSAAIYLDAPRKDQMYLELSKLNKVDYTTHWGTVDHAYNYQVVPIYRVNDQTQPYYAYEQSTTGGSRTIQYPFKLTDHTLGGTPTGIGFRVYALAKKDGTGRPTSWYSDSAPTDLDIVPINQPMTEPKNVKIEFTDGNKKARVQWDTVDNAQGYELIYYEENAPGNFGSPTQIEVKYTNTQYTEAIIQPLQPDVIRGLKVLVTTLPRADSWNSNSPQIEAYQDIRPFKIAMPVKPYFKDPSSSAPDNPLTIGWDHGTGYDSARDQYRVWIDLPADQARTQYNGTTETARTTTLTQLGNRTHHIQIAGVPRVLEHNRVESDVLDFYILTGTTLETPAGEAQGIRLPLLDDEFQLTSDPIYKVRAVYKISDTLYDYREFVFKSKNFDDYDGTNTAGVLIPLSGEYTNWATMHGELYLELYASSGRIYYTDVVNK